MERIVIEVSKTAAKKWRASSKPKRKTIATMVAKALQDDATHAKEDDTLVQARLEASVNEASLAKEWLSEEDSRWDALLK